MLFKVVAILSALAVLPILGQYIHEGDCPSDVPVVQNFEVDKYMGKWFEIKRYEVYFQRGSECSQALYTKIGETIFVENSSIKNGNPRSTTNGTAILADPTADPLQGQLIVAFRNRTPGTTANYNILDTDYDNYSIVFNCQSLGNGKSAEVAWILSRTATVNPDVEEKINVIVEKYLQKDKLRATVQDAVTCGY